MADEGIRFLIEEGSRTARPRSAPRFSRAERRPQQGEVRAGSLLAGTAPRESRNSEETAKGRSSLT